MRRGNYNTVNMVYSTGLPAIMIRLLDGSAIICIAWKGVVIQ